MSANKRSILSIAAIFTFVFLLSYAGSCWDEVTGNDSPTIPGIVAAFQWEPVPNTFTVRFVNTSTGGKGQNNEFLWRFGDGSQSNEINPLHSYPGCGAYNVSLVACPSNDFTNPKCANVAQPVFVDCSGLN